MNANQVVIVMDREKAERWVSDAGQPDDLIENDIARALLRDPDALEARITKAIKAEQNTLSGIHGAPPSQLARSVLAALSERGPE